MTGVNNNKQVNQVDLNQFKVGVRINQQDSDVKKSIFNKIDKDGDGVIEKGEYEGIITAKFKGKDGKPIERQMIKLKSLEKGRSLCVDQNGKQWVVAHDGTVLNDKYVENPEQFKANAKYQQQVQTRKAADKHAQNFYQIADDNSGYLGGSVTKMKSYWDKNVNSENVIQMLDSYQNYLEKEGKSDSSIIDTITSETGASAAEQRVMLTTILQTLCKAAREAGVSEEDIKKAREDFVDSMNTELNAPARRTNPKDMEKAIDFLRGAIVAKQNAGGEITEKQAIETVAKDFSDQNDRVQKEYRDAREEDGWAASVGDTVCGWFGCTTVEDMDKKLGKNAEAAKLLATAKTEEEFKVRYKEVFGIEFDKNKIAARDVALGKYQQASAMKATIKVTNEILANSNSKDYASLRAEIKEKFQINDDIADTIIANYGAVTGNEIKTEADKREMLLHFLKETKSSSLAEYKTLTNGKTLDQMCKDLELLHKSAFGTSDIAKDVAQFNENMVVTDMVTQGVFEVAGTIALQFVPGLGQMAAAKLAVSAAKWGTRAVKVANAAVKAEKAFAAVAKVQQGAGMSSKIASKAAKVSYSMATTGVATATVGVTNGEDAKAVMKKTLMNMSFAGVGVGANELAPKLMSAFGVNRAIANELAEEIINAAGSYGITKIAGDDYGSTDAFVDLATGMALARLGHIKGGVDVNAPKSTSAKPEIDIQAKPQVDVASAPRREDQVSMRATSRADVSSQSSVSSNKNIISSKEWTSAGVNSNGTEIKLKQNAAGNVIVDLGGGRAKLVSFAEGQTRIGLGKDANGVNLILTKSPNGEIRLSKLDPNSRVSRLDNRANPEPRKSSLDTEPKPTPVVEKPATKKSSSRYLDKPIKNENLANLAKNRYPNASDDLKQRLLDIDDAIAHIDDPYILGQINKMQDIDEIERLADIMNELSGNYSAYQRVLKYQDSKYLVKSNAAEFSTTTRDLDAAGHKAFMDGEDVSSLSGNDNVKGLRDDLAEETRLYSMKEYLKDNNRHSEISDYLYNKYYLDGLDVSPATKARMQEITSTYNTRIFLGQDTQNVDQVLDKLEDEFRKFEQASNYQCKFPPVVDFNRIRKQYFQKVPGSALSEARTGSLSFSYMDEKALDEALRHELIHSNDKFLKNGIEISADKFPDVFPQNPKIDPKTGDYIIDLNECKYADEFRKAGIDDWLIEYAHTEPKEFVAVAAEGDMSKYSLEFQNVLKKMGMPDWAFNLPAPVKNIDASANVGPVHVGKIGDDKVSASPFRRFKEMFGGSSEVNLSKNYDVSASRAKKDYPNEGIVRSGQHQRALSSTAPSTVKVLDSSVNPRNIAQHVENGGVCSINGKLYANSNGKAVELKMSQQTFEHLFPEKGFAAIKQQGHNNCWLVSSLNAMGDVAEGRVKLYSMIEELPNGAVKVQLPDESSLIFLDGKPLVAPEIQLGEGAAPGVEMIEQAVLAKHVKELKSNVSISSSDLPILIEEANSLKNTQFKAFSMLHGKGSAKMFKANLNETTSEFELRLKDFFEKEYRTGDFVGANWGAHARHITNYDPNTQMITIHDPYYDGVDIQMPLDKFAKKYPSLVISKGSVDSRTSTSPGIQIPRQETPVQTSRPQRAESAIPTRQPQTQDVIPTTQQVQSSVATNPQAPRKFMLASMEKEVGTVNGQPIKARLVARSTRGIATVEVGGKTYDILPNEKTKIAPGIELECDSRGLVKVVNTQNATPVQPKTQVSSQSAPEVKPQTEITHNTRVSVEQKTTIIMAKWRTVATTADGSPIDAKVQGDVVIISKNGKETEIPIERGESIPVHETSTDSYLIIKREGYKITITTSDVPEID